MPGRWLLLRLFSASTAPTAPVAALRAAAGAVSRWSSIFGEADVEDGAEFLGQHVVCREPVTLSVSGLITCEAMCEAGRIHRRDGGYLYERERERLVGRVVHLTHHLP